MGKIEAANVTMDQALALGGREWVGSNGMRRIYIGSAVWARLMRLEVHYYKTGNISSATLDGADISNSEARGMLASKIWVDKDGLHARSNCRWTTDDEFVAVILEAIEKLEGGTE